MLLKTLKRTEFLKPYYSLANLNFIEPHTRQCCSWGQKVYLSPSTSLQTAVTCRYQRIGSTSACRPQSGPALVSGVSLPRWLASPSFPLRPSGAWLGSFEESSNLGMMTDLAGSDPGSLALPGPDFTRSVRLGALVRVGGTDGFCFHSSLSDASLSFRPISVFLSSPRCCCSKLCRFCCSSYCCR